MQHHNVLRTVLTVYPPNQTHASGERPNLCVELLQGSFFTIVPCTSDEPGPLIPRWYSGNIYAIERATPQIVPLPTEPANDGPTQYYLFVSGDYEVVIIVTLVT